MEDTDWARWGVRAKGGVGAKTRDGKFLDATGAAKNES
jgi:hypothetical protein